jgi:hypothetical protein
MKTAIGYPDDEPDETDLTRYDLTELWRKGCPAILITGPSGNETATVGTSNTTSTISSLLEGATITWTSAR